MKKIKTKIGIIAFVGVLIGGGYSFFSLNQAKQSNTDYSDEQQIQNSIQREEYQNYNENSEKTTEDVVVSIDNIPAYSGKAYIYIDNNEPNFTDNDKKRLDAFESYSELDNLGRCGIAYANICIELMPTEERQAIGQIKPSGWHTVKYNNIIDGNYLYNRCHLIGYQLAGENANEKNLITGTRYLNVVGMLEFEDIVSTYVQETNNHVLYRVTPVFTGTNLLANGIQIEAWSVEDCGKGVCFNVFCYNVLPGINIDYATGDSQISDEINEYEYKNSTVVQNEQEEQHSQEIKEFVINMNTKKFHLPDCSSVSDMSEQNKSVVKGTIEEIINEGYIPCKRCIEVNE